MAPNLDGLYGPFRRRTEAMLRDPVAVALGMRIVSGYRSEQYQAQLFRAAVRRYGSERAARKWVAPPGYSNHGPKKTGPAKGKGTAVDLGLRGVKAVSGQWPADKDRAVRALAKQYGLRHPMAWEDWHVEHDFAVPDGRVPGLTGAPAPADDEEEEMGVQPIRLVKEHGSPGPRVWLVGAGLAEHVKTGPELVELEKLYGQASEVMPLPTIMAHRPATERWRATGDKNVDDPKP